MGVSHLPAGSPRGNARTDDSARSCGTSCGLAPIPPVLAFQGLGLDCCLRSGAMGRALGLASPLRSLALAVTLAACGGVEGGDATSASEPVASDGTSKPPFQLPAERDRTAAFRYSALGEPWGAKIITAMETEPGWLTVHIRLIRPPRSNGSVNARRALRICRGALRFLRDEGATESRVNVMERNGTLWVRGHARPFLPARCNEV